jgi:enoyl-CoA hydratase/carnithine racemase
MSDQPLPTTRTLRLDVDGAVGRITLARPERLNALSRTALQELTEAAAVLDAREEISVVVIAGEGRAFCAGFDLTDPTWSELGPFEESAVVGRAMAEAVADMRAVTIAAIQGHCVGGGVVLASACDLRVAADSARFRIPEVDLGVPLMWTGIPRLVRELGPAVTKELVLTARPFDAAEARVLRFVNRVVAEDDLGEATRQLAEELAARPSLVLRTTKRQVEQAAPPVPAEDPGARADVALFGEALRDPECRRVAAGNPRVRVPGPVDE